jgi:hypothetical protein
MCVIARVSQNDNTLLVYSLRRKKAEILTESQYNEKGSSFLIQRLQNVYWSNTSNARLRPRIRKHELAAQLAAQLTARVAD